MVRARLRHGASWSEGGRLVPAACGRPSPDLEDEKILPVHSSLYASSLYGEQLKWRFQKLYVSSLRGREVVDLLLPRSRRLCRKQAAAAGLAVVQWRRVVVVCGVELDGYVYVFVWVLY